MIEKNSGSRRPTETETLKFHHNILLKSIKILTLYEDMWVEVYGIVFLQSFCKVSLSKSYTISHQEMEQQWENALKNKFDEQSDQYEKQQLPKRTRFTAMMGEGEGANAFRPRSYELRHSNCSFEEMDNQVADFLVNLLSKRVL
jgi:hypothetical protein